MFVCVFVFVKTRELCVPQQNQRHHCNQSVSASVQVLLFSPYPVTVFNGFNWNPHFSHFWPENLYWCSYLLKKPKGRCLGVEFLLKRSLLTVLTEIHIFQPFCLKLCICLLNYFSKLLGCVSYPNSFTNGRFFNGFNDK
mgnify:FL=1